MGKGCGGSGSKPKGNKEPSAAATPANAPGQLVVKRDIDFLDNELDEAPPPLAPRVRRRRCLSWERAGGMAPRRASRGCRQAVAAITPTLFFHVADFSL